MVISSSVEYPILDALVTMHYDHLDKTEFVWQEIERRKKIYSYKNRPIHNLPIADAKPDVEAQLDRCVENLLKSRYGCIELVGTSWHICVQRLHEKISSTFSYLRALRLVINYDATDLVPNYQRLLSEGVHSHYELPIVSVGALQRYNNGKSKIIENKNPISAKFLFSFS
jgi:hypothetical protein